MWDGVMPLGAFDAFPGEGLPRTAAVDDAPLHTCPKCGSDEICEWCGACLDCGRCRPECRCEDCQKRYPKTLRRLRVGAPKQ